MVRCSKKFYVFIFEWIMMKFEFVQICIFFGYGFKICIIVVVIGECDDVKVVIIFFNVVYVFVGDYYI